MAFIPTKHVDGDVAVVRNASMGGKLSVAGNATFGHNVTVKGWLEAVNIKATNKGVFQTLELLNKAYPNPQDGWFAGVGTSAPFMAYIGQDGVWTATGGTIDVSLDTSQYTEDVAQLQDDIANVKTGVEENASGITELREAVTAEETAREEADAALQTAVDAVEAAVDAANLALENAKLSIGQRIGTVETRVGDVESKTTATEAQLNTLQTTVEGHGNEIETLNAFMGSKDEPNGIAPLDDDSQVPETNLPESVFGVLPFDMVVEGETSDGALIGEKGDGVAYDTVAQCFYAYEQPDKSGPPTRYYKYWLNGTRYGDDSNNRKPYGDKIYLNTATNTLYQWNGSSLVAISSKQVTLTQSAYDALVSAGTIDEETYYNILEE